MKEEKQICLMCFQFTFPATIQRKTCVMGKKQGTCCESAFCIDIVFFVQPLSVDVSFFFSHTILELLGEGQSFCSCFCNIYHKKKLGNERGSYVMKNYYSPVILLLVTGGVVSG